MNYHSVYAITNRLLLTKITELMQHRPDEESRIRHDANHDLFTLFCYIPT
ncbi:hypothetical protein THOE12_130044 [Vibrio rotiferianus]|nr:hypothetical protein THOE12_130044 [Vibrio rotiferianus]